MQRIKCSLIFLALFVSVILLLIVRQSSYNINNSPCEEIDINESNEAESVNRPHVAPNYTKYYKVFKKVRSIIKFDLKHYNFSNSGVNALDDLLLSSGGQPIRSVIISTWRSGSSFLGQILNAMPGTFYHYEPFFEFLNDFQIRDGPLAVKSLKTIKKLLTCEYDGLDDYFNNRKDFPDQFKSNKRLWDVCNYKNDLCFDVDFMTNFCKLFPFQSIKLVRLRLYLVREILQDEKFNVRIVLLIRDPRAIIKSRKTLDFCHLSPDCWMSERLCADMVSDYHAARELMKDFPNKLKVIRYEELALNPSRVSRELYSFLRLGDLRSLDDFLSTHTSVEEKGDYSVRRVTKDMPFKWKDGLDFNYVNEIQTVCKEAMHVWGYSMAYNASHMNSSEFYPLGKYTLH